MPTTEHWILTKTFKSAGDESGNKDKLMKLDASGDLLICSGATDIPIGVLLNKPNSATGSECIVGIIGYGFAIGAAALNEFDLIGTDGSGLLDAKVAGSDTTEYVIGQVIEGSTATSDLVMCIFSFATPHRAA